MVQFAFLFFVAFTNFMAGVEAAVYLGKAPRDLRFLPELVDAIVRYNPIVRGKKTDPSTSEDAFAESSVIESETGDAEEAISDSDGSAGASTSSDADQDPAEDPSANVALEEKLIEMSAQEGHLRQFGQSAFEDHGDELEWESLLENISEDIQKLLQFFNEARYLVEQERETAPDARQACLGELDTQWNAINQQSMQLLVMSSEPDPTDESRSQLSTICAGILSTCSDTRQSCTTFMESASLERQTVPA